MLTYACPTTVDTHPIATKEELMEFLKTTRSLNAAIVSKEFHESGKPHYHAFCRYNPKLTSRNARYFDFKGVHPNIGTRDNAKKMIDYVTKDNDYITYNIDVTTSTGPRRSQRDKDAETYNDAMNLAMEGKLTDAHELLRTKDPVRWTLNNSQIRQALLSARADALTQLNPPVVQQTGWTTDAQHINLNEKINGESYARTHILVGAAGIGKTQLAKFLLQKSGCQHIAVVRTAEQLKEKINHIDGFVFDELNANAPDVRGGRWTRESQIALVDQEEAGAIPARYGDVILAPHIKRIITTNALDRAVSATDAAIARRVTIHDLMDIKLFE